MKRLLTYLFLVLCLGLVCNVGFAKCLKPIKCVFKNDKEITNGELIAYLKTNVSREAFSQAREQDPTLVGNHNQVLMRYR